MIRLVLILLGVDYLRRRSSGLYWLGVLFMLAGIVLLLDSLDRDHFFPLGVFAGLLAVGGVGALTVSAIGKGGLRIVRLIEGLVLVVAALLVVTGNQRGGFWLAMILGALFLIDGLLQCASAVIVRYPRWRWALGGGLCEIAIAVTFFSPYPLGYDSTVPYALSLALMFIGWGIVWLAARVRALESDTSLEQLLHGALHKRPSASVPAASNGTGPVTGGPRGVDPVLTVHVWTPTGAAKAPLQRRPLIDRYIAAVDTKGAVWTGHVAMEAPGGLYISLDPAKPIKRSLDNLRMLHAAPYNNVEGYFQTDYVTDAKLRGHSTEQVHIRNYDESRLHRFWGLYRQDATYNLTRRNCAVSVARALEAGLEGAVARQHDPKDHGWGLFLRLLLMPEFWVAAQIRKRAKTMAWTPGLVLDYSRALDMLAHPPAIGWNQMSAMAWRQLRNLRRDE
jgi:uncharacterized membrane protein HdeD (DUF308 family)